MSDIYSNFIKAIPSAATSPGALAAYVVAILCSTVVGLRTRRHGMLLAKLKDLPPGQRIQALELEMGAARVPPNLSPEQWLRSRIHTYVFMIVALVCGVGLVITLVALTSKLPAPVQTPDHGAVLGDIDLYQPPSGTSTATAAATGVPPGGGKIK